MLPGRCLLLAGALAACAGKSTSVGLSRRSDAGTGGGQNGLGGAPPDGGASHCVFQGFAPAVSYGVAHEPTAILAIDRTHAGRLDLVVGERSPEGDTSELFVNQGDGRFAATASYGAASNDVGTMVAADFDGDARLDLVSHTNAGLDVDTTDHTTGVLGIDFGVGDGMFAPALVTTPTPRTDGDFAVGDFNGDGHPDLVFPSDDYVIGGGGVTDAGLVSLPGPEETDLALTLFMNRGDGTFAPPTTYPNLDAPRDASFGVGDFDGDGHLDFAERSTRETGGFGVFFNAGDGTLGDEVTFDANEMWGLPGLGVADFDADGKDDIAITTISDPNLSDESKLLQIFSGAKGGTFNGPIAYPLTDVPAIDQIAIGDFNGDGHPDLALVMQSTWGSAVPIPIAVFQNLGDGTFAPPVSYDVGGQAFQYVIALAAADFNGDGVTDLAVTTSGEEADPNPESVTVLLSECR